jgi:menaquinone-dependent protoporphyrinogen oxidase
MRVLVATASKHGATAELGQAIANELTARGVDGAARPVEDVRALDGYDAVVLGSAVYAGRWLPPAREFVERFRAALWDRPVFLFSSGPVGEPPKPEEDPLDAAPMVEACAAREHVVFAGKIDRKRLGFGEKAIVLALRAPEGDFRDWNAVRAWAAGIADRLRPAP